MNNSFNRRLATGHNKTWVQNPVHNITSTPTTTSTYNSIQPKTTTVTTTRNSPTCTKRSNRTSSTINYSSRILQQHVFHPQEKRWITPCIQPEIIEQLYTVNAPHFKMETLQEVTKLIKNSSRISEVSTLQLERTNLPVFNNPVWSLSSPMALHQIDKTNLGVGAYSRDSNKCIPGRLNHHSRFGINSNSTHSTCIAEAGITRMDHQLQEINSNTNTINRTPRLLIGYYNDDSTDSGKEIERFKTQYSTSLKTNNTITSSSAQPNHANSSRHFCFGSSRSVHPTFASNEESNRQEFIGLGQASAAVRQMYRGAKMVERQSTSLERQEYLTSNTPTNNFRVCQQHRLGMQLTTSSSTTTNSIRSLDSSRSPNVYQLKGAKSSISCATNFPQNEEHENFDSYRQHHFNGIYEQTRWNQISTFDGISDRFMEMVLSTGNHNPINTRLRHSKHHSRLRISSTISQKQLDDQQERISSSTTTNGGKRRRSFCRSDNNPTAKIRLLASGSGESLPRRIYHSMEPVSPPLPESTMELYQPLSSKTTGRASPTSNYDHSLVAISTLVPNLTTNEPHSTLDFTTDRNSTSNTNSNLANDQQSLESRRVEIINNKFINSSLNDNAKSILMDKYLDQNSTNQSYKQEQLRFIEWTQTHNISPESFTPIDLIKFLSDMHTQHSYAVSTLQLFRSAVTHFHQQPQTIRLNEDINTFITTLLKKAPPIRLHRPTISLQPSIDYLTNISNPSFASLQSKLAFLLGFTYFLRPSDLHRIPYSSVSVSMDQQLLLFEVHKPKEKRGRRHIIKSFSVKAHTNARLCPIKTFLAMNSQRPQSSVESLFLHSLQPHKELSTRTIQSWISKLIKLSTTEKRVSLRSVASSLALQSGIPKEDIVTMGNWASSTTFENHYRREHLSSFDFTNTLLQLDQDSDEDIFYDANVNL
ncbi:hypothetical protein INT47_005717 [Mucor saturninus]|uniref:Core-binding (CB) domain-containing protein n=1 Tax=Mucor saturninus TaxID=64648 RepID=A0A8H7QI58_9FUNG|nr:hypothetical protein INT47_005717 [Mucor saturninus]